MSSTKKIGSFPASLFSITQNRQGTGRYLAMIKPVLNDLCLRNEGKDVFLCKQDLGLHQIKGSFTLAAFDTAVCDRQLHCRREMEIFLSLHGDPQTTATSLIEH